MARSAISDPKRRTAYEPLYDIDPQTGASVEIFYADRAIATSFGTSGIGWFWSVPSAPYCRTGRRLAHLRPAMSLTAILRWIGE